jgi:hypothetical protein
MTRRYEPRYRYRDVDGSRPQRGLAEKRLSDLVLGRTREIVGAANRAESLHSGLEVWVAPHSISSKRDEVPGSRVTPTASSLFHHDVKA